VITSHKSSVIDMSLTSSILEHSTVVTVLGIVLTGQRNFQA